MERKGADYMGNPLPRTSAASHVLAAGCPSRRDGAANAWRAAGTRFAAAGQPTTRRHKPPATGAVIDSRRFAAAVLLVRLPDLQVHLQRVRRLHQRDLADGFGQAPLPFALARKYPGASGEWRWQFVFPSRVRARTPDDHVVRRWHASPEYAEAKALRQSCATTEMLLAEGLPTPFVPGPARP